MKNLFALLLCLCTALSMLAQAPNTNYDPDWDGDGNLGVSDLLGFLGLFGDFDIDEDGVWDSVDDCTDLSACNFDHNPTVPCMYSVDAIGVCGGWCESDENGDGICDFTCGLSSMTYYDYSYKTAQIGEQCWLAENLRNEYYTNGDLILSELTNNQWNTTSEGAQAVYQNDSLILQDNGRLYNWHAVNDSRGLCPSGWHVPTHTEYELLIQFLGGTNVAAPALKSSPIDNPPWNGTNESGYSALPAGYRHPDGGYSSLGIHTDFWTATSHNIINAHAVIIWGGAGYLIESKQYGFSIRCIQD